MIKDLVVRIAVPVSGGVRSGTGYPVARDLLLTARHVLHPTDRDPNRPIKLHWLPSDFIGEGELAGGVYDLGDEKADIVWENEALDAALIRFSIPRLDTVAGWLIDRPPRQGEEWFAAGYPETGRWNEGDRTGLAHLESFEGTAHEPPTRQGYFEVTANPAPRRPEDWGGASGMPLFRNDTSEIIGIATRAPPYSPNKLHAVQASRLLTDPRLKALLAKTWDIQKSRKNLRDELARLVTGNPKLGALLRIAFGMSQDESVVDELVKPQALEIIGEKLRGILREVCDNFQLPPAAEEKELAEVVLAVAAILTTYHYPESRTSESRQNIFDKGLNLIEIKVSSRMVAEFEIASVEGRAARHATRLHEKDDPAGRNHLPAGPLEGIGDDGRKAVAAYCEQKWSQFYGHQREQLRDGIIRLMGKDDREGTPMDRSQLANAELKMAYHGRGRPYYCCKLRKEPSAREAQEIFLKQIAEDFPHLLVFKLSPEVQDELNEIDLFGHYRHMLPIKPGNA